MLGHKLTCDYEELCERGPLSVMAFLNFLRYQQQTKETKFYNWLVWSSAKSPEVELVSSSCVRGLLSSRSQSKGEMYDVAHA